MDTLIVLHEPRPSPHGCAPEDRSLAERLRLGLFIADKPQGPTSHQVSAWVRDMAGASKAGHAGTLDPRVTGVLPIALRDATRALEAMVAADKEYVGVLQLHQDVPEERVRTMLDRFVGEVFQMPPVRSAVKRELRIRRIHELEPLEMHGREVLFRVRCESGTYVRTLCKDTGDALGVGAHLADLRRTRAGRFEERDAASLIELRDAFEYTREGDPSRLLALLRPMESLLEHLAVIVVKDTAVDTICHGADLSVRGIAKISPAMGKGELVALLTAKGEGVALANALMTAQTAVDSKSGIVADTRRVLMVPGTYPPMRKA